MLVVTRRKGEAIEIGSIVTVTILEIKGGKIQVGIDAPKEVSVHRREVSDKIRETSCKLEPVSKENRK